MVDPVAHKQNAQFTTCAWSDSLHAPKVLEGILSTPSLDASLTPRKLLKQCRNMSLADSAKLLLEARCHINECRQQPSVEGRSLQISDTVLLPDRGTAYFVSDLEGRVDLLVALLEKEKIFERWRANDPHDLVVLCLLGDLVDRSTTSSLLVEFLLELKCRHGLSRHIIILPGNHELFRPLQEISRDSFYEEVIKTRSSYADPQSLQAPAVQEIIKSYLRQRSMSTEVEPTPLDPDARLHQARSGIWLLFNEIFSALPRTIISPHSLYAAHAGFPVREAFQSLFSSSPPSEEEKYQLMTALANLPHEQPDQDYLLAPPRLIDDIIWSDIDPHLDSPENLKLFGGNGRGPQGTPGPGVAFGSAAFQRFAQLARLSLFIRGHQANTPRHSDVTPIAAKVWSYGDMLTIANGMNGGFAALDLRIKSPRPAEVRLGHVSAARSWTESLLRLVTRT